MNRGIHHIGVATHDMEKTLEFYEDVLGFPAVVCETIQIDGGGAIRHAFFNWSSAASASSSASSTSPNAASRPGRATPGARPRHRARYRSLTEEVRKR